ncbi:MAG: cytochrome c biogenesis protein ResB [Candidatus Krumholzibacteriia bacterium]
MRQKHHRNPIVRALGSLKLTLAILAVFAVAIAVATFVESRYGSAGARALIYNARWFEALLALLVVNLVVALAANVPYRKHQTGYVVTHIAFVIVMIGAGITRFFAYEGSMPIREGQATDYVYSSRDYVQLQVGEETAAFPVRFYKPGTDVAARDLVVGDERFRVAVEQYWPHVDERLVEAEGGQPVLVYGGTGSPGEGHAAMHGGDSLRAGGVTVHFMAQERARAGGAAERGEMVVSMGGGTHRLAVPAKPPAEITAGGYRFRITELAPDFRVGAEPDPGAAMNNPAIRVAITAPDGTAGERLLFAFHPEFNMGHAGADSVFATIAMTYDYGRHLYLFAKEGESLSGVADFDLFVGGGETPERAAAGDTFAVAEGAVLRAGGFAFLPVAYWPSAVHTPVASDDENLPPGARIAVSDDAGNAGAALVKKWEEGTRVDLEGREVEVTFGPIRIDLPYRLHLDDFVLVTYPGSDNPASFESHVRIYDDERGVDGRPARIYMNHPLTYRGFKHFQSSYDRDRRGTVLSVNHDPGKLPTYIGYFFVGLGFIITLTRGIVWNRRPAGPR